MKDERAGGDAFTVDLKGRGADMAEGRLELCAETQSSASWTALLRDEGLCSLIKCGGQDSKKLKTGPIP